ncbi:hypothetical protein NYA30BAC_01986 [Halomonas sp. NYA30]
MSGMQQKDLELKLKIEEMACYFFSVALPQYPAKAKRIIGESTERQLWFLLEKVIETNHRYFKKTGARDIDVALGKIRSAFRMARRRGYLQHKHHQQLAKMMWEIGSLLNGWMAWIKSHSPTGAKEEAAISETLAPYDFS